MVSFTAEDFMYATSYIYLQVPNPVDWTERRNAVSIHAGIRDTAYCLEKQVLRLLWPCRVQINKQTLCAIQHCQSPVVD